MPATRWPSPSRYSVSVVSSVRQTMRSGYVGKDKSVPVDNLADLDGHRTVEHRPVPGEGVKLAALSALVDARGKIVQQRAVELAAGKRTIQVLGIDAGQDRAKPAFDHTLGQVIRRNAPDRKQRRQSAAHELCLTILPDVLEKEIAERHVREAL